ncbi:MAG TPA: tyrosine-type recombinase/integrase [Candidatus Kapabacteria bacterium]|nr:tyrosine-type recombinase/integrase [Candidatus Kapabacteria bacterium]
MKADISKNIDPATVPGSIFVDKRTNKLVVAYKNIRKYTGLIDNEKNRKIAEKIKLEIYLETLGLQEKKIISSRRNIKETWQEFKKEHCINIELKTYENYELAFRRVVTKDQLLTDTNIERMVIDFIQSNRKLSNNTINIYLRAFQIFLNFCYDKKYIPHLQIYKKYKKKVTEKAIEIYSDDEINKLLDYFHSKDYEFKLLIILMLTTGMRIGECLRLKKENIKDNVLILGNKITKKQETVIISSELRSELLSIHKNSSDVFRWKYSSYSRLVRRLHAAFIEIGIETNKSFHEFRKTYLRNLYDEKTPVQVAQKLMRHSNIKVTIENYTKIYESELNEFQNKVIQKYKI